MASFRNSKAKASFSIRSKVHHGVARHGNRSGGQIHSLGTERNYVQALKGAQEWLDQHRLGDLQGMTVDMATAYLRVRSETVAQKSLDLDRQALQVLLNEKLERVKSMCAPGRLATESRSYSPEQVREIVAAQTERYALGTEIAYVAGLRAHELLTLRPASEQARSGHREWSENRFDGREGVVYTVAGKGGLIVEKIIPADLADRLEARRLDNPQPVRDRGINYLRYYDVAGGKKWSADFSKTSREVLGFSRGGHGLRHSYAQEREVELQSRGYTLDEARGVVSQEMGHFSPETTRGYER